MAPLWRFRIFKKCGGVAGIDIVKHSEQKQSCSRARSRRKLEEAWVPPWLLLFRLTQSGELGEIWQAESHHKRVEPCCRDFGAFILLCSSMTATVVLPYTTRLTAYWLPQLPQFQTCILRRVNTGIGWYNLITYISLVAS